MRSSPSSSAKAPSERLGSSHCGTSRLRDFHFIELCPADIPVWLNASRERLLRAPGHSAFAYVANKEIGV